jgi:hypothetical protein
MSEGGFLVDDRQRQRRIKAPALLGGFGRAPPVLLLSEDRAGIVRLGRRVEAGNIVARAP